MFSAFKICLPTISLVPTISLGSHQNIGLHTGARVNVVLLTYLFRIELIWIIWYGYNDLLTIKTWTMIENIT